jgi:hypothetical protein
MIWVEFYDVPPGAPLPGFIYATRLEFTSVLVEYKLELAFFVSKSSRRVFVPVHLWYTNPWVPEGHTHDSSPRDSTRVADSGWVSKHKSSTYLIFDFFNFRLV